MGGLGIRRANTLNRAYSAKLCWKTKFLPNSFASQAIRSKYILNRRSPIPFNKGSHLWSNIGKGWNTIQSSLEWSIGNGYSISLWRDNWTTLGPLRSMISGPINESSHNAMVSSIIHNGVWNFSSMDFSLPHSIISTIKAIPLPSSPRTDIPSSSLATNLHFSIGRAYSFITTNNNTRSLNLPDSYKWFWSIHTQPRLKVFLWLAWWDRLPHKATLFSRSIIPNASCDSCNGPCEDTIHIIRDCPSAVSAWNFHSLSPDFFTLDLQEWIRSNCTSSDTSWATTFSFTAWRLWTRRNNSVFNSTIEHINQRWTDSVIRECTNWSAKQTHWQTTPLPDPLSPDRILNPNTWVPPPTHWRKINVDASHCSSSLITGLGCAIRDRRGSWIFGWSTRCTAPSPIVGELLAIKEGLHYAHVNPGRYILSSDCQRAVNMITCNEQIYNTFANLIMECRELLVDLPDLEIRFEKRSANAVADAIARFAAKNESSNRSASTWNVIPSFVFEQCIADMTACNELSPDPPP